MNWGLLRAVRDRIEANCLPRGILYPWWVPVISFGGQLACVVMALSLRDALWPPDPLLLTIPLVLVAPVVQLGFGQWLPWWLDSLPALVAAGWLLSVAPDLGSAPDRRGARPARLRRCRDHGPRRAATGHRRRGHLLRHPRRRGRLRARRRRLRRPRHPAGGRLRRRRDAAVADARAGGRARAPRERDLAAGDHRRARADRPRDPRPGRPLAERHPAAHHRRPPRAARRARRGAAPPTTPSARPTPRSPTPSRSAGGRWPTSAVPSARWPTAPAARASRCPAPPTSPHWCGRSTRPACTWSTTSAATSPSWPTPPGSASTGSPRSRWPTSPSTRPAAPPGCR